MCNSAIDCVLNLKQFKEGFAITKAKETEAKDRVGLNQIVESKKISNDQELIQSDPTSCPQNQKGNN